MSLDSMPFDILHPVARKEYKCIYCGEKILKGEKHCKATGAWEGDLQDWRMHNECNEAHEKENRQGCGDGGIDAYASRRPKRRVTE